MRVTLGKNYEVFRCSLPNCPHYIREELIWNKESLCWKCGKKFFIDKKAARLKFPNCGCASRRKQEAVKEREEFSDFMKQLGVNQILY
jgi:predicted RNA-binding Zn-ribbon protein involved in translation (DUF1610 family)